VETQLVEVEQDRDRWYSRQISWSSRGILGFSDLIRWYLFAHVRTNNGFSIGISSYLFVLRRTDNFVAPRDLLEMCRFGNYLFAGTNRYLGIRTWATWWCGRYDVDGSSQLAEIARNLETANFYAVFLVLRKNIALSWPVTHYVCPLASTNNWFSSIFHVIGGPKQTQITSPHPKTAAKRAALPVICVSMCTQISIPRTKFRTR